MAIHPTNAVSPIAGPAHSLAIASVVLLFLGACGLSKRVAAVDRISFAAIVTYGFACAAVLIAAAIDGFAIPRMVARMARDLPANAHQWQIVIAGMFQINQACAQIFSVAASGAIILWSVSAIRNGGFSRAIAFYGCIVAPLIIVGISIGHLRLDVHGMAIVTIAQVIWFIFVGWQMCARPNTSTSAPAA